MPKIIHNSLMSSASDGAAAGVAEVKRPSSGLLREHASSLELMQRMLDVAVIVLTLVLAVELRQAWLSAEYVLLAFLAVVVFELIAEVKGVYRSWRTETLGAEVAGLVGVWLVTVVVLMMLGFASKLSSEFSRVAIVTWVALVPIGLAGLRVIYREVLHSIRADGRNSRTVAFAGCGKAAQKMAQHIRAQPWMGLHLLGAFEMREGSMAGHSRRVADLARSLAQHMGLSNAEIQDVFLAGLLHDVGKIGLSDRLLEKPFTSLSTEERFEVIKHPIKGQTALMALEQLQGAAVFIRGHHERFDGLGYPDKLAGLAIPLGARILAVANDYDSAQFGTLLTKHLKQSDAVAFIIEGRGRRYDAQVVDAFMEVMGKSSVVTPSTPELVLRSEQIKPGMVLSRDLMSKSGELLLAKDYILDVQLIGQILNYERLGEPLIIYISAKNKTAPKKQNAC
jgi:HD-GYP domain-containing protein (c-di-GMP phosphodiesterase class II)